jgi:hypothetical protein
VVIAVAGVPLVGTQGCATVLVPTAVPGLLRLALPITVLAPPTVAPTAGIPVVALVPVAGVLPAAVVPVLVVVIVVPGMLLPHGPATVLMVDPTVLFGAPGRAPTGFEVAGTPPAVAGAATGVWLGVVVVVWLGVVVVVWLGVWPGIVFCAGVIPVAGTPPIPVAAPGTTPVAAGTP